MAAESSAVPRISEMTLALMEASVDSIRHSQGSKLEQNLSIFSILN